MKGLTKKYLDELKYEIIGSCIEVHKELGPGLLESVYHKCLKKELTLRRISFISEFSIPVLYKGEAIDADLKCDLCIESAIVVELPKGILINFNVNNIFHDGQKTLVNNYFRLIPD